jgi:hypothetical protein
MTNDETSFVEPAQPDNPNQIRMTNDEVGCASSFVIRASSLIRHSGFVIRI